MGQPLERWPQVLEALRLETEAGVLAIPAECRDGGEKEFGVHCGQRRDEAGCLGRECLPRPDTR